ncbi:hypothetical protein LINPERHAP2_LOCUS39388 [Linum perenne]
MTNIDEQINKLNDLLAAISINSEPEDDNIENDKIILDYSSDENPYTNYVKTEKPENSRKRDFNNYSDGQISFDEYLYKNSYTPRKNGGWNKIPQSYIPKYSNNDSPDVLDLDCSTDPLRDMEDWKNRIGILIQINEDLKSLAPAEIFNFIIYKTTGIVYHYLGAMDVPSKTLIYGDDALKTFEKIIQVITQEFLGRFPQETKQNTTLSQQAIWHLTNLRICNMCYLEPFICEFRKYYYQVIEPARKDLDKLIYAKLPPVVASKVEATFEEELRKGSIPNTLGGRIFTLQAWHKQACNEEKLKEQAKIKLCCEQSIDKIGKYGCKDDNEIKYYRKRHKNTERLGKYLIRNIEEINIKNLIDILEIENNTNKKVNKRNIVRKENSCRCWLCNEEGHYANKCPKKNKNDKKQEVLRLAYDYGFEPIEDSDCELSDIEIVEFYSESSSDESE